jgi:hypothetical protein
MTRGSTEATVAPGSVSRLGTMLACALLAALACLGALPAPASAVSPATISKSFGASSIPLHSVNSTTDGTTLSFVVGNPNPGTGLTNLGFTDNLPAGLVVANPNGLNGDTCGGTRTATAGSSSVSLSGGSLGPAHLCAFSVNVIGTARGKKENSVTINSSAGTGNTSTAILQVGTITPGPRVYWTNLTSGSIGFADPNGGGGGDLDTAGTGITGSNGGSLEPDGVALDLANGRIYWPNNTGNTISYANLDGSGGGGNLNTAGATPDFPTGVAIDQAQGRIYWGNQGGNGSIEFANLAGNGGGGQLTITGINVGDVTGLAIDPTARLIYWSKNGGDPSNNKLAYANLDTGAGHDLVTTGQTYGSPAGVAAPPAATKLYVAGALGLSTVNLDNTGASGFSTGAAPFDNPWGIGLDLAAGRVYWANSGSLQAGTEGVNTIGFANLDNTGGGGGLDTTGADINEPTFLALLEVPVGAGAPVVTGGSTPGSTLSCSQGAWGSDVPSSQLYRAAASFAYSWSVDGQPIAGATASTYTAPTFGDYRCTVTATNVAGSSAQTSDAHAIPLPEAPGTPGGLLSFPLTTRPTLSALGETNSIFAVGPSPTPLTGRTAATRHKRGTVFSFRLDQAATVKIAIQAKASGRRMGRTCRPDSPRLRRRPRCVRTVSFGTLTRTAGAGANRVAFSGRIGRRPLQPGRYQAVFTASDAAVASPSRSLSFTIVQR